MSEIKIPDLSTLRRIKAISRLSEGHLIAVANHLRVQTAKKNQFLINAGSTEKTSLYIIKGKVSLRASDGKDRTINVGENDELRPVAQLHGGAQTEVAVEDGARFEPGAAFRMLEVKIKNP